MPKKSPTVPTPVDVSSSTLVPPTAHINTTVPTHVDTEIHTETSKNPISDTDMRNLTALVDAIESLGLEEFIDYIKSPWKLLWPNFIAGIARGFGALVGATIVIALVGWFLSTLIDIPLIGTRIEPYITQVQNEFKKFTDTNNYNPHFIKIEEIMTETNRELRKLNSK